MKRPALLIGFPYVLGLVLASRSGELLPVGMLLLSVAAAVLYLRRELWKYVLLGTLSCLTACCVYWQHTAAAYEWQRGFSGQQTVFTGEVSDVVLYRSGYVRYYLDGLLDGSVPARVELFCDMQDLTYGDTLTISGTPELIVSGYLYDTESYARSKGVMLSFYMPEINNVNPLEKATLRSVIYNWRMKMTERILQAMGDETGPLLTGMLFGDKSGMSRSSKTALYRVGVGHVLTVSGLHLDFLALCAAWVLDRLSIHRKPRFIAVMILCGLFVICAGETVPVRRAFIMIFLREGALLVFRKADALNSLSIAALVLGIENPYVIHSASFWLSCTAAYGISVAAPYMTKKMPMKTVLQRQWRSFLMFCWAFVVLLPVCAYYFREISLISPVSNTLLVPVCMLSLLLGMLAILSGASGWLAMLLLQGADLLNTFILRISDAVARIPWTHAPTGSSMLRPLLTAGLLMVVGCCIFGKHRRYITFAVLLGLAVTGVGVGIEGAVRSDTLRIAVLGSGKSCVLVIAAEDEAIIADMSGSTQSAVYAEAYLAEFGIPQVETLYLNRPSERNSAKYREYFALLPPKSICLLREDPDFPVLFGIGAETGVHREQLFHGARLTAETDTISVEYAGMTFVCTRDDRLPEEAPELMAIYGTNRNELPPCGVLVVLDGNSPYRRDRYTYIGENNLELTIAKDGTCRVRRLYGNT